MAFTVDFTSPSQFVARTRLLFPEATSTSMMNERAEMGTGVVTSRGHVHYVVTEHGIAHLSGKNVQQRAHLVVYIAHPQHRKQFESDAFQLLNVSKILAF